MTTAARVKALLELTTSPHDALLGQLITMVSLAAETRLKRTVLESAQVKQFSIDYGQRTIWLPAYPVLAAPAATFKNDYMRGFGAGIAVIPVADYWLDLKTGKVTFDKHGMVWGDGVLQASWTGGMAPDTTNFIARFPQIAGAIEIQVADMFKRRDFLGVNAISSDGGGSVSAAPVRWLPMVSDVLDGEMSMAPRS